MLGFESEAVLIAAACIFLVAGFVKGVAGVGLPSIGMGLLTLTMSPAKAAALLILPLLATNLWQFLAGPALGSLLRRLGWMMLFVCIGTWLAFGVIAGSNARLAVFCLGVVLIVSAALNLAAVRFSAPRKHEWWLSPVMGLSTGLAAGATGAILFPAVPYLAALDIRKDELVQALALLALAATVSLGIGLTEQGILNGSMAVASVFALLPAFIGMFSGQWLRGRVSEAMFRRVFQLGLLLLGAYLALKSVR
jgi:uncharacterized membrane protein YfcA